MTGERQVTANLKAVLRKLHLVLYIALIILLPRLPTEAFQARCCPRIEKLRHLDILFSKPRRDVGRPDLLRSSPRRPKQHSSKKSITKKTLVHRVKIPQSQVDSNLSKKKGLKGYDIPYDMTIKGLRTYASIHSNLVLPRRFIVPENSDYPTALHGIDLAGTVYSYTWWQQHVKHKPDRVTELNELGFVWARLQPSWNLVLEALITYSALHGNLLVPSSFVVPYGDDSWPKATWGLSLGYSVYRIRSRGDFIRGSTSWSRRDQLDSLGFVWDLQEYKFRMFYGALLAFSESEFGQVGSKKQNVLRVPTTFVIPSTSEWPRKLWGYKLGEKCTAVRQKELYVKDNVERKKLLAEIGFQAGGNASLGWLEVVHAGKSFRIKKVNVQQKKFQWWMITTTRLTSSAQAAAVFSQLNHGDLDVPLSFVVPAPPRRMEKVSHNSGWRIIGSDDAWPWPEYLWGFPLGQRLKDVRVKGAYLHGANAEARRRQLDALGFNWKPKRGRKPQPTG